MGFGNCNLEVYHCYFRIVIQILFEESHAERQLRKKTIMKKTTKEEDNSVQIPSEDSYTLVGDTDGQSPNTMSIAL